MPRYIDAEKLERFFTRDDWDTPDERWRPESEFGRFVDSLPAEDVAPVIHGKWIERWHENKHVIGDMACSVCGAQMLLTFPKYCPICWAKMDEEEDNG